MVQRISVTVPDKLHAEMQDWKEHMNVSALCSEAIKRRVAVLKSTEIDDERMEASVKRLLDLRAKYEDEEYKLGYTEAYDYVLNESQWEDMLVDHALQDFGSTFTRTEPGSMARLLEFSKCTAGSWEGGNDFPFVNKFVVFRLIAMEDFYDAGMSFSFEYATGVMEGLLEAVKTLKKLINA